MENYADLAREKARDEKVRLSHHAQKERLEENISTDDIIEALRSGQELEPYPDDPRGPNALIAGRDTQGR